MVPVTPISMPLALQDREENLSVQPSLLQLVHSPESIYKVSSGAAQIFEHLTAHLHG